jgi:hypothetical protein
MTQQIIAQNGPVLLIKTSGEKGFVLDPDQKIRYPEHDLESILSRGYWDKYTGNEDVDQLIKNSSEMG